MDDEHRQFEERWTLRCFLLGGNAGETGRYTTKHREQHENNLGDDRKIQNEGKIHLKLYKMKDTAFCMLFYSRICAESTNMSKG